MPTAPRDSTDDHRQVWQQRALREPPPPQDHQLALAGSLSLVRQRSLGDLALRPLVASPSLWWRLRNAHNRLRGLPADIATQVLGSLAHVLSLRSSLTGVHYRPPARLPIEIRQYLQALLAASHDPRELTRYFGGTATDYGVLSTRVVTNNGVGFIVDAFQNLVELELMKFHGFGTGTTAEASSDSALVTELTTQYATDNTRPTGTQTETSANVYSTAATLTPDADVAITEHGIFSQASNAGGVLLDRSKFAAVNLVVASGDSLAVTYNLTLTAGG